MGTLYVVGVPADNPLDMTLRAVQILRQASLIVAQDIPRAQKLLAHYGIETTIANCLCNKDPAKRVGKIIETEPVLDMLASLSNHDVALLVPEGARDSSVAPALVRAAVERGIRIASVPGPSAAVTALITSGLSTEAYVSLGFLPQHDSKRHQLLASLVMGQRTLVAFEAASRLPATLRAVIRILGNRLVALSALTDSSNRSLWRGQTTEALIHCENNPPSGDWAIVIDGAADETVRWPEERVQAEMAHLLASGLRRRVAARQIAQLSNWRTREVYDLAE